MKFSFIQKFGAALLATVWLLWGSNMIGDWIIPAREAPSGGGTVVASAAPAAKSAAAKPKSDQVEDIKPLLAKADIDEGKKLFRKCTVCHTAQKGAGSKIGPDLWNVVGRPKASFDHFSYSDAMKGKGGDWTYDALNHFIAKPRDFVPGTKMTFAGLKKPQQRADVIAYLRTLNDTPPPLPTITETAPAAAKPAAASEAKAETKPAAKPQAASATATPGLDIKALLAKASVEEGKKLFHKCKVCHNAAKGAGNKIGPNLWDVVGRPKGTYDGFSYSDAMKKKGGDWTYEDLFHFIADPRKFVPGTRMTFLGLKKPEQQADVIAYLRTLNDSPPPLP